MNGKQNRAFNAARRAIMDLVEITKLDPEPLNGVIALLASSTGVVIGSASAAHSLSPDDLHSSTIKAAQFMQENAAKTYAEYLAREASASGKQ